MNEFEKEMLRGEIINLKKLDHPNILKMFESYECEKRYYIVTDVCGGGELFEEITSKKQFSEYDAAILMKALLQCIHYCHSNQVMHRDLKPENILLEENKDYNQIKIIDFGSSADFSNQEVHNLQVGTSYYIAPEVIKKKYNYKCDIWSCGVIAFILLSGRPPFNDSSDKLIMEKIEKGKYSFKNPVWQNISETAKDFVSYLLTYEASARPDAAQALEHAWIKQVK